MMTSWGFSYSMVMASSVQGRQRSPAGSQQWSGMEKWRNNAFWTGCGILQSQLVNCASTGRRYKSAVWSCLLITEKNHRIIECLGWKGPQVHHPITKFQPIWGFLHLQVFKWIKGWTLLCNRAHGKDFHRLRALCAEDRIHWLPWKKSNLHSKISFEDEKNAYLVSLCPNSFC